MDGERAYAVVCRGDGRVPPSRPHADRVRVGSSCGAWVHSRAAAPGGVAQFGRALRSQRRGRRFKSDHLHHENRLLAAARGRFSRITRGSLSETCGELTTVSPQNSGITGRAGALRALLRPRISLPQRVASPARLPLRGAVWSVRCGDLRPWPGGSEAQLAARAGADVELPAGVAVAVTEVAGDVLWVQADLEELVAGRMVAPCVHAPPPAATVLSADGTRGRCPAPPTWPPSSRTSGSAVGATAAGVAEPERLCGSRRPSLRRRVEPRVARCRRSGVRRAPVGGGRRPRARG
jgi:hypothetical protein